MSDIAKAREAIAEAQVLLAYAIDLMYREPAVRRADPTSSRYTFELSERIRAFAAAHPDMPMQNVANYFGVNIGRVSEALHGQ